MVYDILCTILILLFQKKKKKNGDVLVRMEYSIPHGEVEEKDW
jgi:hypothetical protein